MNKSEPIVSDKIKILTCDERIIYNTASVWNTSKLVFILNSACDHIMLDLAIWFGFILVSDWFMLDLLCSWLGQIITSAVSFGHVIAYFGLDILFLGAVDQGGVIWINSQRVGVLNIWSGNVMLCSDGVSVKGLLCY